MIDFYRFGEITVDGKKYNSDVIIFPDHVKADWGRRDCHQVCMLDVEEIVSLKPDVLVLGTGRPGLVEMLPETLRRLEDLSIRVIARDTIEACRIYNQICSSQRAVAAIHLTC